MVKSNLSAASAFHEAMVKVSERSGLLERKRLLESKLKPSFPVKCYVNSHLLTAMHLACELSLWHQIDLEEKFPLFLNDLASTGSAGELSDLIDDFQTLSDSSGRWRTTKKKRMMKDDSLFKTLPNGFLRLISYSKPQSMNAFICLWFAECVKDWGRDGEGTYVLRIDNQRSAVTHQIQFQYNNHRYCISVVGKHVTRKKGTVSSGSSIQKERARTVDTALGLTSLRTGEEESTSSLGEPIAHKIPMVGGFHDLIRGAEEDYSL